MQIYLESYYLYNFNKQKIRKARYMIRNLLVSQKYKKLNENNVKYINNIKTKN